MTNHQMHAALAQDRADEISRHPQTPRPSRDWSALAPVASVLAGFLTLLALAAPSL